MSQNTTEQKKMRIGDYVLSTKIGQGGAAEIFKGRQVSLDREVAIKVLSSKLTNDPDTVRRFELESMVIAKLNHPNIVHVIDKGYASGRYYFVMAYIDGTSLREVIDSKRIPLKNKLEMIVQVCKALDYAHNNGVIHRDIKPSNVLIDRQGNALVADFGIAQLIGSTEGEVTSTDLILGTLAYMSPEQKISSTNVDQTTDIYALGIIIYEILAGKKPLGHFKKPTELSNNLDSKFDEIVLKCLAQEPKDRYQRAVELKNDILDILNQELYKDKTDDINFDQTDSFMHRCRYLDTIKETAYNSTVLVENKLNKKLYVIKKHNRGEMGRKEAKLLGNLEHENILNVFGAGGDDDKTVIILEYAQGGSLSDRMVRKYNWKNAFKILIDILKGLDHAHKNNIIHGNMRPSNILFDSNEVIKLSDFGMPAHYNDDKEENWYSSPEKTISKQSDIFALGVILHRMLMSDNPKFDDKQKLIFGELEDRLPEKILSILEKMVSYNVENRYSSCQEILLDIKDFNDHQNDIMINDNTGSAKKSNSKSLSFWAYPIGGFGILLGILATLYFTGFFN
jgi:serine/threonine-protein kinase